MDVPFKLVVKTPNQRVGDLQVDCLSNWTVEKLKQHLSDVYPTKPESSSQKLIYSGRLLQDSLKLGDVFDEQTEAHTVHIVCTSAEEDESSNNGNDVKRNLAACSAEAQSSLFGPQSGIGVRHRGSQQSGTQPTASMWAPSASFQPMAGQYMQQMGQYHMQNMMQYWTRSQGTGQVGNMQQWQTAMEAYNTYLASSLYAGSQHPAFLGYQQMLQSYPSIWNVPPSPSPSPSALYSGSPPSSPGENAGLGGQVNEEGLRQQPAQPPAGRNQRQQGVRMNAGGAMFEDDDDEEDGLQNRDWLDWTHTLLRVGVLFSIMYFYSTMSRLLLVCILGLIIYLYQAGYFSPRRGAPVEDFDVQGEQDNNANRLNENDAEDEPGPDNENEAPIGVSEPERDAQVNPPHPGVLTVIYSFVTSFFTSLIPTGPPPIQQP